MRNRPVLTMLLNLDLTPPSMLTSAKRLLISNETGTG